MTDFTLSQQLQTDAALAKLDEVFAFQFQEELEEVDFAEALPESADPEELDRMAPALIRYLIQSGDKGYKDGCDFITPIPSQENNWLFDPEEEAFKGRFTDRRPVRDQSVGEAAHGGEDQSEFLLVMLHIGRFLPNLGHQDDIAQRIEVAEGRHPVRQLIPEDQAQRATRARIGQ